MMDIYRDDGCIHTLKQIGCMVAGVEAAVGWRWVNLTQREQLIVALSHPLNDVLYRQQALEWVASAADQQGLTMALYGRGWEKHPGFSRFARGPIEYGQPLEEATRRTKINLQIIPNSCMHQRLLDGLAAGGFFLVRGYPGDPLMAEMWSFFRDRIDPAVTTVDQAMQALAGPDQGQLGQIMQRFNALHEMKGVDQLERFQEQRVYGMTHFYEYPPRLDEVTFDTKEGLQQLIERFVGNDALRQEIAEVQRRFIEQHYTYAAGMRYVIKTACHLIGQESGIKTTDENQLKKHVA